MSAPKRDLSKVRHALRTPINHILGYCEMLQEEEAVPADFRADLERIRNGGRQLLGLINEYFDDDLFESRRRDLRQVSHDLRTPVSQIVGYTEILLEQAEETGRKRIIPDLKRIHAAAKTWLTLAEQHLFASEAAPASRAAPSQSTQTVMPCSGPAAVSCGEEVGTAAAEIREGGALLVVDDDAANRLMLSRRLRRQGYTVRVAENGARALGMLHAAQFDLVLLDLMMPGLDGLEVLQRVRRDKSRSELPIIMVTGKDSSADVVQALQVGANDYVTKPVDFLVALARIRTHLSLKRAQEELKARMEEIRQLAGHLQKRNEFIKQVFGRYVTDDVVQSLLDTPQGLELGGQKRVVTILMSDLRGFTTLAERLAPEQVVEMLNVYLGAMAEIIAGYQGVIDEFIGDAILAVFGAPVHRSDHAEKAVACALAMQLAMEEVNAKLRRLQVPQIEMGIGVNTGEVVVGNIGSTKRAKYGVVGRNVNLAGRIQSATVGAEVLVSESTAHLLRETLAVGRILTIVAKGVRDPVTLYSVRGLGSPHNLYLRPEDESFLSLPKEVPVRFFFLGDAKQVTGGPFPGSFTSVSPKGAVLRTARALQENTDLKLQAPCGGEAGDYWDLYGKVRGLALGTDQWTIRFTFIPPEAAAHLCQAAARQAA
jgi:class 3 adenylate cyclase